MKQEIKFKAHHIPTGKDYWFDVMWGSVPYGSGWIGMLPIEQKKRKEIKSFTQLDDRIPIDPHECEITPFINEIR
jgi:hypothetical protein